MYKPIIFLNVTSGKDFMENWKAEEKLLEEANEHARKNHTYVGRSFRIPHADSYAVYQIVSETERSYRVQHVAIGDAWEDHYFGNGGTFPKSRVMKFISWEDGMKAIFGGGKSGKTAEDEVKNLTGDFKGLKAHEVVVPPAQTISQGVKMDRQLAKKVGERIVELTKDAIKKEFGLDVSRTGGSYDSTVYKMKLEIGAPLAPIVKSGKVDITNEQLHFGMGKRGTPVTFGNKEYLIVTPRRSKYLVEPVPADGKQYVIPFERVNLSLGKA